MFTLHQSERIALLDDGGDRFSYVELNNFIKDHRDYVPPRSFIFVLCENKATLLAWVLTMLEAGAVPLLLSKTIDQDLLASLINIYKPSHLFVSKKESLPYKVNFSLNDYTLYQVSDQRPELHPELELLLSTSGSTGSPKLVRFQRGVLENNARNVSEAFDLKPTDVHAATLPLNYVMGLNALLSHLYVGARILLSDANIMDQALWDFLRSEGATNFTGVPFSYEVMVRLGLKRLKIPSLNTLYQGGGKLRDELFQKMAQMAKDENARFIATYGTTETSARCSYLEADKALEKTASIGKAIPGVSLSLVDEAGQKILTPHREGELVVQGNNVTFGYAYKATDLIKGDEFGGTYHTGDLAYFDEEGYFFIVGRKKRFVKLLGNRVGLDECEMILKNKGFLNTACLGQDDLLMIITADPEALTDVVRELSSTLGMHQSLFKAHYVQNIPLLDNGKTDYRSLEASLL